MGRGDGWTSVSPGTEWKALAGQSLHRGPELGAGGGDMSGGCAPREVYHVPGLLALFLMRQMPGSGEG